MGCGAHPDSVLLGHIANPALTNYTCALLDLHSFNRGALNMNGHQVNGVISGMCLRG